MPESCVFCEILAGREPVSMIYQDSEVVAFMSLRPTRRGECLVIPRIHVDHFIDLSDELAARIIVIAQRIGRRVQEVFLPQRVGMVVHGYGVPHAHLIIVPQQTPYDITSAEFSRVENGKIVFDLRNIPVPGRNLLDADAESLRIE